MSHTAAKQAIVFYDEWTNKAREIVEYFHAKILISRNVPQLRFGDILKKKNIHQSYVDQSVYLCKTG